MSDAPLSIATLREGYRSGQFTPVNIAQEILRRVAAYADPAVWISKVPETTVIARARALAREKDWLERLPLYGIPFAVKDNIDCAGLPTTAACPDFAYMPERDAHSVARLLEAGAILIGKTNLDQFATGLVGARSPYGVPHCVFDENYVSGGSSSGSAVAVAASLVSFALGTDTAGSGRVPAAYNNIVGLKPTRGLVSTSGVVPACRTLDCVSIFAGTTGDADAVLKTIAAFDAEDPYSRRTVPRELPTREFRFGVLGAKHREVFGDLELDAFYDSAITRAVAIGGTPVEIDYGPFAEAGALLYDGPWVAERYAALEAFIAANAGKMNGTVRTIIERGKNYNASSAFTAEYRRMGLVRAVEEVWNRIDVLLLPTVPGHDRISDVLADPIAKNARLGQYTNFVNLLDCCAVAVPAFFRENGLPFGVTLVAPAFVDASLAVLADRFHRSGSAGSGLACEGFRFPEDELKSTASAETFPLFVVGAHLKGLALNGQLQELGAEFAGETRTSKEYRLYALPNAVPPKPGMILETDFVGPGIAGEVWNLTPEAFGKFVANIPPPLGVGKVKLADGGFVSGFLCESYALTHAEDITVFGGWRNFLAKRSA